MSEPAPAAESQRATTQSPAAPRTLVAGIGNIFFGDDAFGSEVARRLLNRPWPPSVHVVDFGIRGLDLAYTLLNSYDTVILIDALERGGPPGTLYVIEPEVCLSGDDANLVPTAEGHGAEPARVLQLAARWGARWKRLLLVGCEPGTLEETPTGMSRGVDAAVTEAIRIVERLVQESAGDAEKGSRFPHA